MRNPIIVNFVGASVNGNPTPLSPIQAAGVLTLSNWNNVAQSGANGTQGGLKDSSGFATSASITWSSDNLWSTPMIEANANYQMMKGYLDNPTHDITISVSGLPYGTNDVYVYFNDDNNTGGTIGSYTIGSKKIYGHDTGRFAGTFVLANGISGADPDASGNYLIFRNISGSSFTINAHPENAVHRSPINGVQIVPVSP